MLTNKNLECNGIGSKHKAICIFHITVKSQDCGAVDGCAQKSHPFSVKPSFSVKSYP